MLTMQTLKPLLERAFFGPTPTAEQEKRVVPLRGNFFIPTAEEVDTDVGTWIGYMLLSTTPNIRTVDGAVELLQSVKQVFRVALAGANAEELAYSTLLWNDRYDIKQLFEHEEVQLMYTARTVRPFYLEQGGMNKEPTWITEIPCMGFNKTDTDRTPWVTRNSGGNNG